MEKYFVGFHIFIMNFTKLGNISRKMRKTSMCKGFEQREMLFKKFQVKGEEFCKIPIRKACGNAE